LTCVPTVREYEYVKSKDEVSSTRFMKSSRADRTALVDTVRICSTSWPNTRAWRRRPCRPRR